MFHKTVHKTWNLFKHSEQLLENYAENPVLRLSISWKFFSIDRGLFLIDRTEIE